MQKRTSWACGGGVRSDSPGQLSSSTPKHREECGVMAIWVESRQIPAWTSVYALFLLFPGTGEGLSVRLSVSVGFPPLS